jgi:hypothetical protein
MCFYMNYCWARRPCTLDMPEYLVSFLFSIILYMCLKYELLPHGWILFSRMHLRGKASF